MDELKAAGLEQSHFFQDCYVNSFCKDCKAIKHVVVI